MRVGGFCPGGGVVPGGFVLESFRHILSLFSQHFWERTFCSNCQFQII